MHHYGICGASNFWHLLHFPCSFAARGNSNVENKFDQQMSGSIGKVKVTLIHDTRQCLARLQKTEFCAGSWRVTMELCILK